MTGHQEPPPVAEWLRGRAQAHRRASTSYERAGQAAQANVHTRVAAELSDLAKEADAFVAEGRS